MKIENIEIDIPVTKIKLDNMEVLVKSYLPTQEKMEMIEAIKFNCFNDIITDQAKLDALFNAYIVLGYTDIEFESTEIEDLIRFYDYLEINGYMTLIIAAIPKIEYNALIGYLNDTVNDYNKYKVSINGFVDSLVAIAPVLMERIQEISKDIDIDALKTINKIYSDFK